jgi:hypothetical protein
MTRAVMYTVAVIAMLIAATGGATAAYGGPATVNMSVTDVDG